MRLNIQIQAELLHYIWTESGEEEGWKGWLETHEYALYFVPAHVLGMFKSDPNLCKSFVNLCHHSSDCMKNDGDLGIPTKENVILALEQL
jgi:hypothetical protein